MCSVVIHHCPEEGTLLSLFASRAPARYEADMSFLQQTIRDFVAGRIWVIDGGVYRKHSTLAP